MSILLFSAAWLLLASASLWRCGNTTKGEMEEIKGLLKQWFEFLHNGLRFIHSSLKRGSALGPTLPNVLMISMCKECWSWYWGSSRKDANCIFTRSSSYIEYTNECRTVNIFVSFFFFLNRRQAACVCSHLLLCDSFHDGPKGRDGGYPHWAGSSTKTKLYNSLTNVSHFLN